MSGTGTGAGGGWPMSGTGTGAGMEAPPLDEFWDDYADNLTRFKHGIRAGKHYLTEYLPSWKEADFLLRTQKFGKASWKMGRGKIALFSAVASGVLAVSPDSAVEVKLAQKLTDAALSCTGAVGALAIAGTGLGFVVFLVQAAACAKGLVETYETVQVMRGNRSIDEPGLFEKGGQIGEGAGIVIDVASLAASMVTMPLKVLPRMGAKNIANLGGRGGAMMRVFRDHVSTTKKIFYGLQGTQIVASLAPYVVEFYDETRMKMLNGYAEVERQIEGLMLAPCVSPFGNTCGLPPFGLGGFQR